MVRLNAKVGKRKETRYSFLSRLKESLEKERNKLSDRPSPTFLSLNYLLRKQTKFIASVELRHGLLLRPCLIVRLLLYGISWPCADWMRHSLASS